MKNSMDIKVHCTIAFLIRVGFIFFGCFQDSYFKVKYTDIDYEVFNDAARYVWNGKSPFKRHTYRYTPLLAFLLTPNIFVHVSFGKLLFGFLDIVTSLLIYHIQKDSQYSTQMCKFSAFLWLYNPLTIVISTRGSSESVMTCLIMLSIYLYQINHHILFGLVYGFSIHMKIYPCIYVLTFYFALSDCNCNLKGYKKIKSLFFPNQIRILFVISTLTGFIFPTAFCMYIYGNEYLYEGFLYHLIRKDVKHNFSPYFYLLYLSETMNSSISSWVSYAALLIQASLIFIVSLVFSYKDVVPSCLFLETFIFVTFNKVCTSQYFLWYLCLLPLSLPLLNVSVKSLISALLMWFLGQGIWLIPAYMLEFEGKNTFFLVFVASLIFFCINIFLMSIFIRYLSDACCAKKAYKIK